ncbi:hypothetical protein [Agathobacter rectalis]|uniref:hypothetical protein n=1 Tax=Agathobacter rectalis TaxID=39491 RepID=UPI00359F3480
MTVEEVKKIIDEESLKGGNLFEKRKNKENEMVIMNVAEHGWYMQLMREQVK